MSRRSSRSPDSAAPKKAAAICLLISVLPTPVGPQNSSTPIGRRGSCMPALKVVTNCAAAAQAASWPMIRSRNPQVARQAGGADEFVEHFLRIDRVESGVLGLRVEGAQEVGRASGEGGVGQKAVEQLLGRGRDAGFGF